MSATVSITLSPRAQALLAAAPAWPIALKSAIAAALDKQNGLSVGHITKTKLKRRGPLTLGVVSSRLWTSVRSTKPVITGDAILSSIGSNVRYAGVHEFGFSGIVKVGGFTRRQPSNDQVNGHRRGFTARQRRETVTATGFARVRAHTRRVKMPARAMFRSGIEERLPAYSAAISQAVVNTLTA